MNCKNSNLETDNDISTYTHILNGYTETIPAGSTYLNKVLCTVPSDAREVIARIQASGNLGGVYRIIKGGSIHNLLMDFNQVTMALMSWSNGGIHLSYIFNYKTVEGVVTFDVWYK